MSKKILIVDDDELFSSVLKRALERRHFAVAQAFTGEESIKIAREFCPDWVTLDLNMPGKSGLFFIEQLVALNENIKVVVLTGYSSIATAVDAIKRGALNYLCKPANTEEILAVFEGHPIESPSEESRPSVNRVEWEYIQKVLAEQGGNVSATARVLGMHRRTLQRKLTKRPVKK